MPRQATSTNGQCGSQNGNTICPAGSVGTCCSPYGWCGNTPDHCGTGCQSGCGTTTPPPATGGQTTDGSCGAANGGTICGTWPTGGCCSQYGWCGSSSAHCDAGCQSGPCTGGGTPGGGGTAPGPSPAPMNPVPGNFAQLTADSGVPAMHAALMPNGRVVFLDKVEDYTQLRLANGQYAYSSEYNPVSGNTPVPLAYSTNAFCSGGTFLANGDLIAIGGNGPLTWLDPTVGDGFTAIRYLTRRSSSPSSTGFDWREPGNKLNSPRWYPSAQTLADGRVFVVSGSKNGLDPTQLANNNPTYEFLNSAGVSTGGSTNLPILVSNQPYYMYPFLHLLRDGRMFIFTSKSSQILNMATVTAAVNLPALPGLYRTYPNTGGSVMFPLKSSDGWAAKIMICGGGSYQDITSPTDPSCGVIAPEATTPTWEMDSMPQGRGMVEAVLLPDGKILWLNGANRGAQGFNLAEQPTTTALLYDPLKTLGTRFTTLATSAIPRLYHSVALLLLDGTVLVTGSGPNEMPVLTDSPFRTDFRMERYTPPYFIGTNNNRRPTNVVINNKNLGVATAFTVTFTAPTAAVDVKIVLYHGGFVTHSVHMGHRMVYCDRTGWVAGATAQTVVATTPPNKNITPPGPYVLYVVVDGIPSAGQFVMIV
ncbi:putative galactose oxidase [Peziza echinospora]|nr:putative galactose oxidase [Peziza echinospora]